MTTKLSIILVSWNTSQLLSACLHSVGEQFATLDAARIGTTSVETLVVDNASSDESVTMIRRDFPWVRLLENRQNVGFAAANNQAMAACTGEMIWLLNPDTLLLPSALATLLAFMEEHPEAGAAGSCLLNPDGTLQQACSPAPTLSRELWRLLHLDAIHPYTQYPLQVWQGGAARQVDVVQGASFMVRRPVLDQIGFFDTDYFMYTEEVDLCHRIRAAGWKIYWVPQSRVLHYGGQSTQQAPAAMFLQLYQTKVTYFRKRQGAVAARLYKTILLAVSIARLALVPLTPLQKPDQRTRHMALAGHYLRLVLNLHRM
jgi:N-acetylglucosaminyl-diphospho-decaprenol L-rhamnosyltransferase